MVPGITETVHHAVSELRLLFKGNLVRFADRMVKIIQSAFSLEQS